MQKTPCALLLLWTHGVLVCAGLGVQDGPCLVRQRRRGFGLASTLAAGTRSITLEQRAAGVEQWVVGAHAWTASKKPPGAHARAVRCSPPAPASHVAVFAKHTGLFPELYHLLLQLLHTPREVLWSKSRYDVAP